MENASKLSTENVAKNRTSSGNERYTIKPPTLPHRPKSHRYSCPDETVTVLEVNREGHQASAQVFGPSTSTQNITERPREPEPHMLITEFVNIAYNPDTKRDSIRSSSSKSNDAQPIYANEEDLPEQPIYQNDDEMNGEPIYQNTGELADSNNPELMRCKTMDISQVS